MTKTFIEQKGLQALGKFSNLKGIVQLPSCLSNQNLLNGRTKSPGFSCGFVSKPQRFPFLKRVISPF